MADQLVFSGRGITSEQAEAEVAKRLGPRLFDVAGGGIVGGPLDSLVKLGFRDPNDGLDGYPTDPDGDP